MFIFTNPVYAQTEPIELLEDSLPIDSSGNLGPYLQGLFRLGIGAAIVLSVLVITLGGLKYMTTDAVSGKEEGKDMIQNAIGGLVLALVSVLLLNTINPDLLSFNLLETIKEAGEGISYDESITIAQNEAEIRQRLAEGNVRINRSSCTTGQTTGCTNVVGLPERAIQGLIDLAADCDCIIFVTGGTEGGHVEHGPGKAVVDLRSKVDFNQYLNPGGGSSSLSPGDTIRKNGVSFTWEPKGYGNSTAPHWHVRF